MERNRCLNLETACLFGASAFILDVIGKMWDLMFGVTLVGFTWDKYGNKAVQQQVVGLFFTAVYCTFSFILSFFLFRGIYHRLAGVIKLGAVFVLVLRLWECAGSLVSWDNLYIGPQQRDEFGVLRASKIGKFILTNLASAAFVMVLFLYYKELLPPRRKSTRSSRNSNSTSMTIN